MNWSALAAAFHCSCNLRAICCFTSFCSDVMARRGTEVLLHVLKEPLIFIQIFQVLFFWGVIEAIWEKLWKKGVKEHTKEEKHIFQLQRNVGKTLRGKYKIHQLHQQVRNTSTWPQKLYAFRRLLSTAYEKCKNLKTLCRSLPSSLKFLPVKQRWPRLLWMQFLAQMWSLGSHAITCSSAPIWEQIDPPQVCLTSLCFLQCADAVVFLLEFSKQLFSI